MMKPSSGVLAITFLSVSVSIAVRVDDPVVVIPCRAPGMPNKTLERVFQKLRIATVQIRAGLGIGTAFLISGDGLALTAKHVALHSKTLTATTLNRTRVSVKIVAIHPKFDLAVVKLQGGHNWDFLKLETSNSRINEPVIAIGNSCGDFLASRFGTIVSLPNKTRANRPKTVLELSVPLAPGDSGAPVLNAQGRVVGVVSTGGEDALGFSSFAVPTSAFLGWLADLKSR